MGFLTKTPAVIKLLEEDHKKVRAIFDEFEDETDEEKKAALVKAGVKELIVHAAIEEELVYPAFRSELEGADLLDEAIEEHHVAHVLIDELKNMSPQDERYFAKFTVLAESVCHHIKEEERELFPKAEDQDLAWDELQESVKRRKEELMEGAEPRASTKHVRRKMRKRAEQMTSTRSRKSGKQRRT